MQFSDITHFHISAAIFISLNSVIYRFQILLMPDAFRANDFAEQKG